MRFFESNNNGLSRFLAEFLVGAILGVLSFVFAIQVSKKGGKRQY